MEKKGAMVKMAETAEMGAEVIMESVEMEEMEGMQIKAITIYVLKSLSNCKIG